MIYDTESLFYRAHSRVDRSEAKEESSHKESAIHFCTHILTQRGSCVNIDKQHDTYVFHLFPYGSPGTQCCSNLRRALKTAQPVRRFCFDNKVRSWFGESQRKVPRARSCCRLWDCVQRGQLSQEKRLLLSIGTGTHPRPRHHRGCF
jgi:hypothetical protein